MLEKESQQMVQEFLKKQKRFTTIDGIDYLQVVYLNVNTISLVYSYYYNLDSYFGLMLALMVIEKTIIIGLNLKQMIENEQQGMNIFKVIVLSFLNISNLKLFKENKPVTYYVGSLTPYIACFIYDPITIIIAFKEGLIYKIQDKFYVNMILIQIVMGFLFKSIVFLFLLTDNRKNYIKNINILQFLSIFFGLMSLQGIGLFLLQNVQLYLLLLLWKVFLISIESWVIIKNKLELFGCEGSKKSEMITLISVINIFYFPIDYAPFNDNNRLMDQSLDFKYTPVATQYSIIIVKIGQLIDIVFMVVLVNVYDLIPRNQSSLQFFYQIVIGSIILYICIQGYHIISRTLSHLNQNFTYFFSRDISFEQLNIILKNSKTAKLIEILNVSWIEDLLVDSIYSDKYYKKRKDLFQGFINIQSFDCQRITISQKLTKHINRISVSAAHFIDVILEYIESEECIKAVHIYPEVQPERKLIYQNTIFNRLIKFGMDQNLENFINCQNNEDKIKGRAIVNQFLEEQQRISIYSRDLAPILHTNPQVVYFDLYDSLGLNWIQ